MKERSPLPLTVIIASFLILMISGILTLAAPAVCFGQAAASEKASPIINNAETADGDRLQFAPRRMKDRADYGMELENETGARDVKIERYKLAQKGAVNIFILNTGDLHESSARLHKIADYVKNQRKEHPGRVFLFDAGDMLTHYKRVSRESDWEGRHDRMYQWASTMHYDAMIFGNHDFVETVAYTQKLIDQYALPFACANIVHPDLNVPSHRIIERKITLSDGTAIKLKIGVVGLADRNNGKNGLPADYHDRNEKDKAKLLDGVHPVDNHTIEKLIASIEPVCDFVVLLTHNTDAVDRNHVAVLPGKKIRVIVGGHSHQELAEKVHGKSLVKSEAYGHYVGRTMVVWSPKNGVGDVEVKNVKIQ